LNPGRRLLAAGLVAGALIRALLLPLPGTGDVVIWKVWSFAGSTDVVGMYGVGGSPPERRVLEWQGEAMTVDYPPLALYELAAVGRLYRAARPLFDDSAWLTMAVKAPGIAFELAVAVLLFFGLRRWTSEREAAWGLLAFWLNPAVLLDGAALGYLDAQMAVPVAAAVVAAWSGRAFVAGVLLAVAVLTKAQAVFALPLVLAWLAWRPGGRRLVGVAGLGGLAATALIVLPFVVRGAWPNLMQALGRLATHDMLSAQAANLWWIVTWLLRVIAVWPEWTVWEAVTLEVRILGIERAMELGYPNARVVGLMLVGGALAWACTRARQVTSLGDLAALAGWCLWAYALFAAQVHENHLAAAVFLVAPAAALQRRYRPAFWVLSAVVALNLYLFYGLGDGWPPVVSRTVTIIDATVVLSVANLAAFAWFTTLVVRRTARTNAPAARYP